MKFEVYQDNTGQWRWRLVARNGRIMADSAESYVSERNAIEGIHTLRAGLWSKNVRVVRAKRRRGRHQPAIPVSVEPDEDDPRSIN